MLPRLNQSLLILVLGLKLFLASHMTDVANDDELAVHIAKLSWLDTYLEQDVVRIHGGRHTSRARGFTFPIICLGTSLVSLRQDLEESAAKPTLSEQVSKTEGVFSFFQDRLSVVVSLSMLVNLLLCCKLVLFNSFELHTFLWIEWLALDVAEELL